jgi:hypothetical protein
MQPTWYQKPLAILLLLVFFFPAGLFLMWKYAPWNKTVKWGITGFFLLLLLGASSKGSPSKSAQSATQQKASVVTSEPTQPLVPSPTAIEPVNIAVTSQMVKKVEGKHRYFFDIRNNDSMPFEGSVLITLHNQTNSIARDTFTTTAPIDPGLGESVYLDANTGPVSVHGEFGVTTYTYVVTIDNIEVNSGEGQITATFEDLDLL